MTTARVLLGKMRCLHFSRKFAEEGSSVVSSELSRAGVSSESRAWLQICWQVFVLAIADALATFLLEPFFQMN